MTGCMRSKNVLPNDLLLSLFPLLPVDDDPQSDIPEASVLQFVVTRQDGAVDTTHVAVAEGAIWFCEGATASPVWRAGTQADLDRLLSTGHLENVFEIFADDRRLSLVA